VGVKKQDEKFLELNPHKEVENHIGTVHAAAQFTLAETQSGLYLLSLFPEYADDIVPLLRSSNIKYKYPATTKLVAEARVLEEDKVKFEKEFLKRGKAMIIVKIKIKDINEKVTMMGDFGWYVQRKEFVL
jgi:acyl-coenzyme A thioesterase PaaI-like protein